MLDVFRFAWFAVRTLLGLIALVLALYGGLWLFVKVDSTLRGNADPEAALRLVKSYNAQAGTQERKTEPLSPAATNNCNEAGANVCDRH